MEAASGVQILPNRACFRIPLVRCRNRGRRRRPATFARGSRRVKRASSGGGRDRRQVRKESRCLGSSRASRGSSSVSRGSKGTKYSWGKLAKNVVVPLHFK